MDVTPYQMTVNNIARHVRSNDSLFDAFTAALILSVAFCKDKEEILQDILVENRRAKRRDES